MKSINLQEILVSFLNKYEEIYNVKPVNNITPFRIFLFKRKIFFKLFTSISPILFYTINNESDFNNLLKIHDKNYIIRYLKKNNIKFKSNFIVTINSNIFISDDMKNKLHKTINKLRKHPFLINNHEKKIMLPDNPDHDIISTAIYERFDFIKGLINTTNYAAITKEMHVIFDVILYHLILNNRFF